MEKFKILKPILADAKDKGGCFFKLKRLMGLNKKIVKGYLEITNCTAREDSSDTLSISENNSSGNNIVNAIEPMKETNSNQQNIESNKDEKANFKKNKVVPAEIAVEFVGRSNIPSRNQRNSGNPDFEILDSPLKSGSQTMQIEEIHLA